MTGRTLDPRAVGKCRGCGKTILWGTDPSGARIPLDFSAPIYAATLRHDGTVGLGLLKAGDRKDELRAGGYQIENGLGLTSVAVSHFATCPKANDFSGSKR